MSKDTTQKPVPRSDSIGHDDETYDKREASHFDSLESPPFRVTEPPAVRSFPVQNWDRYIFESFLGEGGMGTVFCAMDPELNRQVALKFIRSYSSSMNERFLQEARLQGAGQA